MMIDCVCAAGALMQRLHLFKASACVSRGGVIAYPTEAVYGLGCDPWNRSAVCKVLALKRRPVSKGLIVVAAHPDQLRPLVDFARVPDWREIEASWPGPVTWLLPLNTLTPAWLHGAHDTLAVRIPDHALIQQLCLCSGPLVSTSANPAEAPPACNPQRVRAYFGRRLDYVLPGETDNNRRPSEIRHALTGQVIRA